MGERLLVFEPYSQSRNFIVCHAYGRVVLPLSVAPLLETPKFVLVLDIYGIRVFLIGVSAR